MSSSSRAGKIFTGLSSVSNHFNGPHKRLVIALLRSRESKFDRRLVVVIEPAICLEYKTLERLSTGD